MNVRDRDRQKYGSKQQNKMDKELFMTVMTCDGVKDMIFQRSRAAMRWSAVNQATSGANRDKQSKTSAPDAKKRQLGLLICSVLRSSGSISATTRW